MGSSSQGSNLDAAEIHMLPVQGNVYMLVGAGANIAVQVGGDGVLVVDTGFGQSDDKVVAAIRRLSDKPIRRIINTHVHRDHTGGNEGISRAGVRLVPPQGVGDFVGQGGEIYAHLAVLKRMIESKTPSVSWPENTFATPYKDMFFNDEAVRLFYQPAAHTDGDVIVFFRRSDVISAGDVFVKTSYPVIDVEHGGTINGIIDALNRIIDLTVPRDKQEGGTMVIPGHGRLSNEADVVDYRDMVTIIRDRIQDMIHKGMTLEHVKAARPTFDYDPLYGSNSGLWTTDMFVEAVYRTLIPLSKGNE
jgi:glyoxylase-like metal-dependent hydrolase (beta-lactamase superfamily II)